MIDVARLSKTYRVANKDAGLWGTLKHFVRRQYRDVQAVREISFQIAAGEVVGFLGPNGAGKTTALKMLTGLIHPTSGQVSVAGFTPFDRRHAFLRQITLVMGQKQQLIWDLPAADSLRINAAVYEIPPDQARRRIDELADMLDLDKQLTQPVRKLSLGERMKTELLAALLHRPSVLFLDEPTLGLDVNAQIAVRRFLKTYNQRYGATILLTSHYMADITALCPRVLVIDQGSLIHDGPLADIIQRFAPYREVRVDLEQPAEQEVLAAFGEIESVEGSVARLIIRREALTEMVSRLLEQLPVADLTVSDPPIEQIIGRVFRDGGRPGDAGAQKEEKEAT